MKALLLLLMLFPAVLTAQQIALIDRNFKRPLEFTDSATMEHLFDGYFPVYVRDLNLVLQKATWIFKYIDTGKPNTDVSSDIPAGNSRFFYQAVNLPKITRQQLVLSTQTNSLGSSIKLIHPADPKKRALQKLNVFMDYVKNNISGLIDPTASASN